MTTILLATITLLLVLILVVLFYHLPEEKRSTLAWRARIIGLWFGFGGSVVSFGLGMLLIWIALTNNSSEMGWSTTAASAPRPSAPPWMPLQRPRLRRVCTKT